MRCSSYFDGEVNVVKPFLFFGKKLLIDCLLHECHISVMSGEKGRSVCLNLIEGTTAQIKEMLQCWQIKMSRLAPTVNLSVLI